MATGWLPILGAALPVAGAAVKLATSLVGRSAEHRLERNLRRHSELLTVVPPSADRAQLVSLINDEIDAVAAFHDKRLHRHIDGSSVAAIVLVLAFAATISFGLWSIALPGHPGWKVVIRVAAIIIGLAGFLLASVGGLSNLWKDDRDQAEKKPVEASGVKDQASDEPPN